MRIRGIKTSASANGKFVAGGFLKLLGFIYAGFASYGHVANCHAQANKIPNAVSAATVQVSALSSVELWLAAAIIIFGLIVLSMQFALLRKATNTHPADILRLFTVTMVVIGTMALIAIGYSSQQIAPALGLFGTILGYLLGRSDERMRGRNAADDNR